MAKLTIKVTVRWWWRWYVCALVTVAWLMRREPDWEKFKPITAKALHVRVLP